METAIKKAIEGGWKFRGIFNFSKIFPEGFMFVSENSDRVQITTWHEILLDPLFWQALGKALGWPEVDEGYSGTPYSAWEFKWHKFIHHIAKGKTPESFFTSLLTQK